MSGPPGAGPQSSLPRLLKPVVPFYHRPTGAASKYLPSHWLRMENTKASLAPALASGPGMMGKGSHPESQRVFATCPPPLS